MILKPFQNAEQVLLEYNQSIQHSSLTQQKWDALLSNSDEGLKTYLTDIKGAAASMDGYTISLKGNITGFNKVSNAIQQYNGLSSSSTKELNAFTAAIGLTNSRLSIYLASLNGAKASMSGYVVSLFNATVKTVALQFATVALNSAITMGASLIISGIVSAISSWIHNTENMINASEDALHKISSLNE